MLAFSLTTLSLFKTVLMGGSKNGSEESVLGLNLVDALAIAEVITSPFSHDALAQLNLTADKVSNCNLGTKVVPLDSQTDLITGGTRPQNGWNLFHSFAEFNFGEGRSVYFQDLRIEGKARVEV